MHAYYNEFEPFAAAWLRRLIEHGLIAPGDVDTRSIVDVHAGDLKGYTQCHFFAGIGGWSRALRLAGWPDDRPVWTGSCPCQPFSVAGRGEGEKDERHLWPEFRRLIAECRPASVFGEQVASKLGRAWLTGVRNDLEALGYGVGAADLCAASVGAPHIRQRLWWVAEPNGHGCGPLPQSSHDDAERDAESCGRVGYTDDARPQGRIERGNSTDQLSPWAASLANWIPCADGKARRIEPGLEPLAHGVPDRMGRLRGYGNAIVPELAATFIEAADVRS